MVLHYNVWLIRHTLVLVPHLPILGKVANVVFVLRCTKLTTFRTLRLSCSLYLVNPNLNLYSVFL